MGTRWILAVTSCLLVLSDYSIDPAPERPEINGRFEVIEPIIRDTVTGLDWQVGPDHGTNWDDAKAWVDGLGGNWRMPTRAELRGLWDADIKYDNWGPFENSGLWVWSGEVYDSSSAWGFAFSPGYEYWCNRSDPKDARAFAVRSPSNSFCCCR